MTGLSIPDPSTSGVPGASNLPKMSSVYGNLQVPDSLNDIGGSAATFANGQNANVNTAFGAYSGNMSGLGAATNPLTTYKQLLDENGIPQLQKTSENLSNNINDLSDQIYRVTPNVTANTSNSLVTDSQRQGMIAAQQLPMRQLMEPMSNQLGQVSNALTTQEQNIANEVNAVGQNNQLINSVGQMGVTVAQDNAARSMTGFTTDQSNTLAMLMKKLDVQQNLDNTEWSTLSDLVGKQQDYQNALAIEKQKETFQTIPYGGGVVNTSTGQKYNASSGVTPSLSTGSSSGSGVRAPLSSFVIKPTATPTTAYRPSALNLNFAPSPVSGASAH